ncbi:MAG TPA: hypothetical protein VFG63_09375 [Nocardioidaceae bacterium]|nr:hypothetical protein [Nocardioidaceae bacterium]
MTMEVKTQVNARFPRPFGRVVAGVCCAVLLLGTAACTGDTDTPEASPSPSPSASTGTAATLDAKPVPLQVRVTRVSGKLSKSARTSLEHTVGRTIGAYFDDAFLGGSYPRARFTDSFSAFSTGAAKQARKELGFLTNARIGESTEAVLPKQKKAWLSVLAPHKVAAGVTAKIQLVFVADRGDAPDQQVLVTGRLLLTRKSSGGWQIFGYDVSRSVSPAEKGASR